MARITPTTITGQYASVDALNQNFADLANEFEKCVYRDGEVTNSMTAALDMNNQKAINAQDAASGGDFVTLRQLQAAQGLTPGLPSLTGNAGKILQTSDGVTTGWIPTAERLALDLGTATAPSSVDAKKARQTLRFDKKGADVASAATIDLDAVDGDVCDVTGTTSITAITLAEGVRKTVRFTGVLTLTHGASLVLPNAQNIITQVGMFAEFRGYASGVVRLTNLQLASSVDPTFLVDAKGDLLVGTAVDTLNRKAVGAEGEFLQADPSTSDGLTYTKLGVGDVRQCALAGAVDANGYANFLQASSGLAISLDASPTPLVLTMAAGFGKGGAQDVVAVVSSDADPIVSGFEASNVSFVHATWASMSSVTWGKCLVVPDYAYAFDKTRGALLNFEGTDTSTTMLDDFGNTWAVNGNAQLDTAQSKFGSSSLLLDGTGDWIHSNDFKSLGGDSWEASVWVRWNALPGSGARQTIWSAVNDAGFGVQFNLFNNAGTTKLEVALSSNGTSHDITASTVGTNTSWATATWYKMRILYDSRSTIYRVFLSVAGAAEVQDLTVSTASRICAITRFQLGTWTTVQPLNGWIDAFRFIRGAPKVAGETPSASAPTITDDPYHWFSIPEMKMYEVTSASGTAGVNPGMTARNRVFVGEVETDGSSVTTRRTYALRAEYKQQWTTPLPGLSANISATHQVGVPDAVEAAVQLRCITTDAGYAVNDIQDARHAIASEAASVYRCNGPSVYRNAAQLGTSVSTAFLLNPKAGGAGVTLTAAKWAYRFVVKRTF